MTFLEKFHNLWNRWRYPSQQGWRHTRIEEPICTYCGGTKWYEGPSGGMSTNILCANPECRHWFNYHQAIMPMEDLHRVEPKE